MASNQSMSYALAGVEVAGEAAMVMAVAEVVPEPSLGRP